MPEYKVSVYYAGKPLDKFQCVVAIDQDDAETDCINGVIELLTARAEIIESDGTDVKTVRWCDLSNQFKDEACDFALKTDERYWFSIWDDMKECADKDLSLGEAIEDYDEYFRPVYIQILNERVVGIKVGKL